jgi:histidine ammonia-lyase
MTACQAIEFRSPLKSSELLEKAHDFVRQFVGFAEEDRIFADDIKVIHSLIRDGRFIEAVNDDSLNNGFEEFRII